MLLGFCLVPLFSRFVAFTLSGSMINLQGVWRHAACGMGVYFYVMYIRCLRFQHMSVCSLCGALRTWPFDTRVNQTEVHATPKRLAASCPRSETRLRFLLFCSQAKREALFLSLSLAVAHPACRYLLPYIRVWCQTRRCRGSVCLCCFLFCSSVMKPKS